MTNLTSTKTAKITAASMIIELNAIRKINGKKSVVCTGTSKSDIKKMIDTEYKIQADKTEPKVETKKPAAKKPTVAKKPAVKIPVDKRKKIVLKDSEHIITAVEIAAELGTDAKSLRRKIRKIANTLPETVKPGRWVFRFEFKEELIKKLS